MQVLDTKIWFLWVATAIFAAGWLNWGELSENGWKAKRVIAKLGMKRARIVYCLSLAILGALLILDLFRAW
jgi:hypothetical protein